MENVAVSQRYTEDRPLPRLAKAGLITMFLTIPVLITEASITLRTSPRLKYLQNSQAVAEYNETRNELLKTRAKLLDTNIEFPQIAPELAIAHNNYKHAARNHDVMEYQQLERVERPIFPVPIYGVLTFLAGVGMLGLGAYRDRKRKI